jgi:hypothetical protein
MRYSDHVGYLTLLVRYFASRGNSPRSVSALADSLSLDEARLHEVLNAFPAIFKRRRLPGEDKPSVGRSKLSLMWGRLVWAVRSLLSRPPSFKDDGSVYTLQPEISRSKRSKTGAGALPLDREREVDRLLDLIGTSAAAERSARRLRWGIGAASLTALAIAMLLSNLGQGLSGRAGLSGGAQADANVAASDGGTSSLSGPPHINLTCATCPAMGPPNGNGRAANQVESPGQDDSSGGGVPWLRVWIVIGLGATGLLLLVLRMRQAAGAAAAPLVTLGSALSFLGGLAAWAQPALTVKADAQGLHNATAAVLLTLLVLAVVVLLAGFLVGLWSWKRWVWPLPAGVVVVVLAVAVAATPSSQANFRTDYFEAYLAASGPERLYAWLLAILGLVGLVAAGAIAQWLGRR